MALSVVRFNNGNVARVGDSICVADFAAGPTPLSVSHDWLAGYGANNFGAITPLSVSYTEASKNYYGRTFYPANALPKCQVDFSVTLILGSGRVRWEGYFAVYAITTTTDYIKGARVYIFIRRYCDSGKIDPRGTYTKTGYHINTPAGSNSTYVTEGSDVVLS